MNRLLPILIISFSVGLTCSTFAQNAVNTSGGDATGIGGKVSYSVGIVAYSHQNGITGRVNQGVQQPYEIYTTGFSDEHLDISLSIYPNPTQDNLLLRFENYLGKDTEYSISDELGKLVFVSKINETISHINLSDKTSGIYYLNVYTSSESLRTFKIIKK